MALAAGSTLGPFRIIALLGRGGMASVYKAYHARLDRHVALKVLPQGFLPDNFAKRFEREARVVAMLEHPNIVPIHDYGIDGGIPWMAMRMLPVGSLADLLTEGRLDRVRVVTILDQVAEALDHAHAHGVIHRDVKPSNILLDDKERVYVGDFGLAHLAGASVVLTRSGMVAGTPQYMAPEQALGKKADHRADIYALGIVAYQMLTGAVPFEADTPVAVLLKHAHDPVPIPPLDQVPETLMRALLRALDKDPAARWQTALAFTATLDRGLADAEHGSTIVAAGPTALVTPATGPVVEGDTTLSVFSRGRVRTAEDTPAGPAARGRSLFARWRLGATAVTLAGMASGYFVAASLRDDRPISEDPPMRGDTRVQAVVGAPSPQPDEPRPDRPKTTPTAIPGVADASRPAGQPVQTPAEETAAEIAAETGFDLSNVRGIEGEIDGDIVGGVLRAPPPPAGPMRVGGNVSAPVKTKHLDPRYPEMARAAHVSGVVVLETVIGVDGQVTDVTVLRSVRLLDDAAIEAVRQWEYIPTLLNGVPVPVIMTVTVDFRLR